MKRKKVRTFPRRNAPVSRNGYNLFDLLSALQKDIRRGNERDAVFWAIELETFPPAVLWNRLEVIASEDIGPANPALSVLIYVLKRSYVDAAKRKHPSYRLYRTNAVLHLCRSLHSRVVPDLVWDIDFDREHNDYHPPIPDYANDPHNGKGSRGDWAKLGRHIENEAIDVPNPYMEEAIRNYLTGENLGDYVPKISQEKEENSVPQSEESSKLVQQTLDTPKNPKIGQPD